MRNRDLNQDEINQLKHAHRELTDADSRVEYVELTDEQVISAFNNFRRSERDTLGYESFAELYVATYNRVDGTEDVFRRIMSVAEEVDSDDSALYGGGVGGGDGGSDGGDSDGEDSDGGSSDGSGDAEEEANEFEQLIERIGQDGIQALLQRVYEAISPAIEEGVQDLQGFRAVVADHIASVLVDGELDIGNMPDLEEEEEDQHDSESEGEAGEFDYPDGQEEGGGSGSGSEDAEEGGEDAGVEGEDSGAAREEMVAAGSNADRYGDVLFGPSYRRIDEEANIMRPPEEWEPEMDVHDYEESRYGEAERAEAYREWAVNALEDIENLTMQEILERYSPESNYQETTDAIIERIQQVELTADERIVLRRLLDRAEINWQDSELDLTQVFSDAREAVEGEISAFHMEAAADVYDDHEEDDDEDDIAVPVTYEGSNVKVVIEKILTNNTQQVPFDPSEKQVEFSIDESGVVLSGLLDSGSGVIM